MSRFIGSKLNVGLLDDENRLTSEDDVAVLPEEPAADNVETQLLEVEASAGDVADVEEQVEEAAEVAEGLEAYRDLLRTGMEEGGVSRREAAAIIMAANGMVARLGGSAIATPGLEHFGSHSQKQEATRIAMESIGDKIKEIWKKILAQLEKAYEWIRKHMLNVFAAGPKLVERAQKLAKAVEANTNADAKEKKIKRGALIKELASKSTGADGIEVDTLANLTGVAKSISEYWPKLAESAGSEIADVFEAVADGKGDGNVDILGKGDVKAMFANTLDAAKLGKTGHEAPEGTAAQATPVLPGNVIGLAFVANSNTVEAQSKQKLVIAPVDKDFGKNASNEEVNVLDKKSIGEIAKHVENLGNYLHTYRQADNKFKTVEERIKKAAKRVGDLVGKEKTAGDKTDDALRAIQKLAVATPDLITGFPAKFYTLAVGKAKHFLDYAELSLAEYKAKD